MEAGGWRGCRLARRETHRVCSVLEQRGIDCSSRAEEFAGPGTEIPDHTVRPEDSVDGGLVRGVRFGERSGINGDRRSGPAGRRGALPGIGGAEESRGTAGGGGFAGGLGSLVEGIGTTEVDPGAGIGLKLPEVAAVVAEETAVGTEPDQPARVLDDGEDRPRGQFRESFEAGGEGESIVGVGDVASDASLRPDPERGIGTAMDAMYRRQEDLIRPWERRQVERAPVGALIGEVLTLEPVPGVARGLKLEEPELGAEEDRPSEMSVRAKTLVPASISWSGVSRRPATWSVAIHQSPSLVCRRALIWRPSKPAISDGERSPFSG